MIKNFSIAPIVVKAIEFQGTSGQLKKVNPASGGRFEAFTNFDKQTSQFLGGSIKVVQ